MIVWLLMGCVSTHQHEEALATLQAEIAEAEAQRAELEALIAQAEGRKKEADRRKRAAEAEIRAATDPDSREAQARGLAQHPETWADQQGAQALLDEATEAHLRWDIAAARVHTEQILREYGGSRRAAKGAQRLAEQLAVIGQPAPALAVERWFTPLPDGALDDVQVVVYWEAWCPHSRREVPKLPEIDAAEGVSVIALTRVTNGATDEQVAGFISGNALSFAVGKAEQAVLDGYAFRGTPSAAVVRDGVIVWRGHPSALSPQILREVRAGER